MGTWLFLRCVISQVARETSVSSLGVTVIFTRLVTKKKKKRQQRILFYALVMQIKIFSGETRCGIYFKVFQGNQRTLDERKTNKALKVSAGLCATMPIFVSAKNVPE